MLIIISIIIVIILLSQSSSSSSSSYYLSHHHHHLIILIIIISIINISIIILSIIILVNLIISVILTINIIFNGDKYFPLKFLQPRKILKNILFAPGYYRSMKVANYAIKQMVVDRQTDKVSDRGAPLQKNEGKNIRYTGMPI